MSYMHILDYDSPGSSLCKNIDHGHWQIDWYQFFSYRTHIYISTLWNTEHLSLGTQVMIHVLLIMNDRAQEGITADLSNILRTWSKPQHQCHKNKICKVIRKNINSWVGAPDEWKWPQTPKLHCMDLVYILVNTLCWRHCYETFRRILMILSYFTAWCSFQVLPLRLVSP